MSITSAQDLRLCIEETEELVNGMLEDLLPQLDPGQRETVFDLITACEGRAEARMALAERGRIFRLSQQFPRVAAKMRREWNKLVPD